MSLEFIALGARSEILESQELEEELGGGKDKKEKKQLKELLSIPAHTMGDREFLVGQPNFVGCNSNLPADNFVA